MDFKEKPCTKAKSFSATQPIKNKKMCVIIAMEEDRKISK
jgi:hypothetical protein